MDEIFVLLLVACTSVGAMWVGTKRLNLSPGLLRQAIGKTLEGMGLTLVFLIVNVGVGGIAILAIRGVVDAPAHALGRRVAAPPTAGP